MIMSNYKINQPYWHVARVNDPSISQTIFSKWKAYQYISNEYPNKTVSFVGKINNNVFVLFRVN